MYPWRCSSPWKAKAQAGRYPMRPVGENLEERSVLLVIFISNRDDKDRVGLWMPHTVYRNVYGCIVTRRILLSGWVQEEREAARNIFISQNRYMVGILTCNTTRNPQGLTRGTHIYTGPTSGWLEQRQEVQGARWERHKTDARAGKKGTLSGARYSCWCHGTAIDTIVMPYAWVHQTRGHWMSNKYEHCMLNDITTVIL